jgi:tetratricopeptide (TPR) repeat protein
MWSRLGNRGLPIVLSFVALLLAGPTPVPRSVVQSWTTARLAAASGDLGSAAQALRPQGLTSPWLVALKADSIRLALAQEDGTRALALLETPPDPQAPATVVACWRAEALALVGRWEESIQTLQGTGTLPCFAPFPLLSALAREKIESDDTDQAVAILHQLVTLDPEGLEDATLLAACQLLVDPAAAFVTLQLPAARGVPLAVDLAEAVGAVSRADRSAVLTAAGQVFLQYKMWHLAAGTFRQLATLEPMSASAHAYYGLALEQSGQAGLSELEAAARLDPASSLAQSLLGLHWQQAGKPQQAIPFLERATALDPESSALLAALASAQAAAGNLQDALEGYRMAAELQPADPVFWRLLASFSIAREIELLETGLPAARNAAVLDRADPIAMQMLGSLHFVLGDRVVAERLLGRSIELDPTSAAARLHYGLLLSSTGKIKESRAQLSAAATLGGTEPVGLMAQRALLELGD